MNALHINNKTRFQCKITVTTLIFISILNINHTVPFCFGMYSFPDVLLVTWSSENPLTVPSLLLSDKNIVTLYAESLTEALGILL